MWHFHLSLLCLLVIFSQANSQLGGGGGFRLYNGMSGPRSGRVGFERMMAPKPKSGSCPPTLMTTLCKSDCKIDSECAGDLKCCTTACGSQVCAMAMTQIDPRAKAGYCPKKPKTPWICNNLCTSDMDCEGNMKCCKNRCGAMVCIKADLYRN